MGLPEGMPQQNPVSESAFCGGSFRAPVLRKRILPNDPHEGERCLVMGILNVTEDSFSDGGRFLSQSTAIEHGLEMLSVGTDIIDVGGESTRPGAHRVEQDVEMARVVPVLRELASRGAVTSVDTMRAAVAEAAITAGVTMINDVSGGRADPDMARVVADAGIPWILMHWRASTYVNAAGDAHGGRGGDIVASVREELLQSVDAAVSAGVSPDRLILDPGLGFAKTREDDWLLLQAMPELLRLGFPVLIGASRKRFLGALLADADQWRGGETPSPDERDSATAAVTTLAAAHGAWGVRVHDVRQSLDAVAVAHAWRMGKNPYMPPASD